MFIASFLNARLGTLDVVKSRKRTRANNGMPFLDDPHGTRVIMRNFVGEDVMLVSQEGALEEWTLEHRGPIQVVDPSMNWHAFLTSVLNSDSSTGLNIALLLDRVAPRAQFVPAKVIAMMRDSSFHFRSSIADLYFNRDLSAHKVLVTFLKDPNNRAHQLRFPRDQFPTATAITSSWFGFADLDEAVLAKMSSNRVSTVLEVV